MPNMNLKTLQEHWNRFGEEDPMWSILTQEDKKNNTWDKDAFFENGAQKIDTLLKQSKRLNPNQSTESALDFGCGIGRLTQGLARHFNNVSGVDIAQSMIKLANENNQFPDKCKYFLNSNNDLALFHDQSFDFIISMITLQHMQPKYAQNYIKEFMRVLKSQGTLIFQIPAYPEKNIEDHYRLSNRIKRKISKVLNPKAYKQAPVMEMYCIPCEQIIRLIRSCGGKLIIIRKDKSAGADYESFIYIITK